MAEKLKNIYNAAHVGAGPGGNGLFIAADREGRIHEMAGSGVVLFERDINKLGQGDLGEWLIQSNSGGEDFLVGLKPDGTYRNVLDGEQARRLRSAGKNPVLLREEAAPFLAEIGRRTAEFLDDSRRSMVRMQTEVTAIRQRDDDRGVFYEVQTGANTLLLARHVILAAGSRETLHKSLEKYKDKTVLSGDILRKGNEYRRAGNTITIGGNLVVIGASHSAFSALDLLINQDGAEVRRPIRVIGRDNPVLYSQSIEDAKVRGFMPENGQVCKETGKINRYKGVRGRAGELLEKVLSGQDKRIIYTNVLDIDSANGLMEGADMIIQATGHRVREIPIYDTHGVKIGPYTDGNGHLEIGQDTSVKGVDGEPIPNVYGIGHGASPSIKEGEFLVRPDSVNAYHITGSIIVQRILQT